MRSSRLARLRDSARPLLQAALAAPLSWLIATDVLGHDQPIFAPIAALVAIGATVAQPWQRAAELVIGVTIGVAVADGLVIVIGQGTWQIGVMVLLTMSAALVIGGSPLFVIQAGTAASIVAALPSADGAASVDRILDSLVGGGVALLFTVVLLPIRPLQVVRRAATPVVIELAAVFEQIGKGARTGDSDIAEAALVRARDAGEHWARLDEAVGVGRQAARVAPVRRHHAEELVDVAQTAVQLDYAIRDARILARLVWRLTELGTQWGALLDLSMQAFAEAARALEGHLDGEYDETLAARSHSLRGVRLAASITYDQDDPVLTHVIGQIRSTAVDILRATGMERGDAITMMVDAARAVRE